jgi:UDP-N-acetylmuramoyl-tripeptide--D-alanyl-D-alanine ligase
MFELGESSKKEHQEIAKLADSFDFNRVYLLGENFFQTKDTKALKFKTYQDFTTTFIKADFKESTLLIKASRGMALERIVKLF